MWWPFCIPTVGAETLGGVEIPPHFEGIDGPLQLNGAGVRERFFFDLYVAALYMPAPTTDARHAIEDDVPKRIALTFLFPRVTREQVANALRWRVEQVPEAQDVIRPELDAFVGWLEDFNRGDTLAFDYTPGLGTTVTVKEREIGLVPGVVFMRALWTIFLGEHPITPQLKRKMLGG